MSDLPTISGADAIRAFEQFGFAVARQNGSHVVLKKDGHDLLITVPVHGNKPLKRGTLRRCIRDAGLTVDEFVGEL